ncbi:MAG: hypothetical protein LBV68_03805, partial [Spirochaetaceae bacterium]|nr:hypothetical protein [Spirochaetaceae bacterium]
IWVLGIGYWVLGIGYWVLGIGYWGAALKADISCVFLMVLAYDECHGFVKRYSDSYLKHTALRDGHCPE